MICRHLHLTHRSFYAAFFITSIVLLAPLYGVGQEAAGRFTELENVVTEVKGVHAPDSRLEVFQIALSAEENRIVVKGAVSRQELKVILLDSLAQAAGELEFVDSIQVLPTEDLQPSVYGIVKVSVAHMRRKPSVAAELVNQTLLGTVLKLYVDRSGYYYVHNWDRYLGWVSHSSVVRIDSFGVKEGRKGPRVVCVANYGGVRDRPGARGDILVDLVPGAVMRRAGPDRKWIKVQLPDGRVGYVKKGLVMEEADLNKIIPNSGRITETASAFLGIPYMWGGTSAKSFDCSGFVQTVFRLNNCRLPRDANQMVQEGELVELDDHYSNLKTGDLLFFGPSAEKITHVAIYLKNQRFIHAAGAVQINSLDPADKLYNEYRHKTLRTAKRMIP